MRLPTEPVQFSIEEIRELNQKLSTMRHDINNNLSLIMAAAELIRHKPQVAERMLLTLCEQPPKITTTIARFSAEFEEAFHIVRQEAELPKFPNTQVPKE